MKRPNILLFMTDQHMLDALGCYGAKICKTPNIDALAEEGTLFKHNYTACPLCSPARACVLTGREVHAHGVTTNVHEIGCNASEIPDSPDLLPRRLAEVGYRCGFTGKWHIGDGENKVWGVPVSPATPLTRGFVGQNTPQNKGGWHFDDFKEYLRNLGLEDQIPMYERNFRTEDGTQLVVEHPLEGTCEYFLAENTINLIDRFSESGEPFFIWHNTWGPHGAYLCHRSFYDMYKDAEISVPENFKICSKDADLPAKTKRLHEDKPWSYFVEDYKLYYALTTQIDAMFGRIVRHLKEKGLYTNTVIIFTSDHGSHFGMHGGLIDKGFSHYEEAQRTGCVIYDPTYKTSQVVEQYTGLIDIYPTILDYAGVAIPSNADGLSLRKLISGQTLWRDHDFVEFYGLGNIITTMLTVICGGYKYGWNPSNHDELYDLNKDPLEKRNLADEEGKEDILKMLREKMYSHLAEHGNPLQYIYKINVLQKFYAAEWGVVPH